MVVDYIKDPTPEVCAAAVKQNNGVLGRLLNNMTPEVSLAVVKQDRYALQYVKEQTPEICMAAVQQDGFALQFVEEQTPEICLAAVKQNSFALQCVKEKTPEICLAAVKRNVAALRYVKNQTLEICLEAIRRDRNALLHINNPTPEICLAAAHGPKTKTIPCDLPKEFYDVGEIPAADEWDCDYTFEQNVSDAVVEVRTCTGLSVRPMTCGNVLLVCENGTDMPVAKLDNNGNLEYYVNGFGDLGDGLEPNLDHDAKAVGDDTENHDDL